MKLKTTIEFFEDTQAHIREKKFSDANEAFILNSLSEGYFAEAIKALEKQIPKKEKHNNCPHCNTSNRCIIDNLGFPKNHPVVYCWNCGQAIDWRDEDEG